MSDKRVLITDDCHSYLIEGLEQLGFRCDFEPDITPEATLARIGQYEGLIINSKINVNQHFLDAATRLQFVGRLGSGMEIVDREYARQKQVHIISSPEGNRNAVAEQALGMLLALANNIVRADGEVRQKNWRREANRGWELEGKTVGIIGFGHTGRQFSKKLAGMDVNVLAFDKYLPAGYASGLSWVQEVNDVTDLIQQADIISLHLPLTAETKHYADQHFFEKCKNGVVLLNTSRGQCVKTDDLVTALEKQKLKGACLDVFENEKPATYSPEQEILFQRLFQMDNVILTPHIAGWTHESKRKMAEILINKIKQILTII